MNKSNRLEKITSIFSKVLPFAITLMGLILVLIGFLKPELLEEKQIDSTERNQKIAITIGTVCFLAGVGIPTITKFLNSDSDSDSDLEGEVELNIQRMRDAIELLRQSSGSRNTNFDNEVKEKYNGQNLTAQQIEEAVYNKTILTLENKLLEKVANKKTLWEKEGLHEILTEILTPLANNIEQYIKKLQKNSIVNLIIGITGTIIAITILSFTLLGNKGYADFVMFLIHFVPRFIFTASIQLFAFFFLRLYKNNLDDAKYFQNELTNISCKISALKISVLLDKPDMVSDILEKLSSVERNFKFNKDETLLNIERAKIEKDIDLDMLSSYKEFLKVFKQENNTQN